MFTFHLYKMPLRTKNRQMLHFIFHFYEIFTIYIWSIITLSIIIYHDVVEVFFEECKFQAKYIIDGFEANGLSAVDA